VQVKNQFESLEEKLKIFEASLSDMELIRLRQLRAADASGVPLSGQATYDEGLKRLEGISSLSIDERKLINSSLKNKLTEFQATLSKNEVTELVLALSGDVGRHQSSFGVSD
jgi:hypothetical protein